MKVICDRKELIRGLTTVKRAIKFNSKTPLLNNILLTAKGGELKLTGANKTTGETYNGITRVIKAIVIEPGSFIFPIKRKNIISFFPNKEIMLISDKDSLFLESGKYEMELNLGKLDIDEFPVLKDMPDSNSLVLNPQELKDAIKHLKITASKDDNRQVLNGILLDATSKVLTMVSADGFQLSKYIISDNMALPIKIIIPMEFMQHILMEITKDSPVIIIKVSPDLDRVEAMIGNTAIYNTTIKGTYPNYMNLIPKSFKTITIADRKELLNAVTLANSAVNNGTIKFRLNLNKKLVISSSQEESGSFSTEINSNISGIENKIALNGQYLINTLKTFHTPQVKLKVNNIHTVVEIHPKGMNNYTYILMPMFVNWN